ncbi:YlmC/YmxH family sporulation protein [Halalkalibacillus sediminis]|uniref:YlmC/YmxH family sporulation protein n=1 Tax=Halalkalibacillus sediminis TaxID=2018042 RepID=A0A2I0QWF1_9BACI|nr:YlmC/YmxH family sporulation protein [Halalkalibacillus sediminis]PKR78671.1 YlmC/YmxH family sporulation protein [Halalkalibacillus sediminis]
MRYNDLSGKELIDAVNGERLGILGQTDLEIDPRTGSIRNILIQDFSMLGFKKGERETMIKWSDVEVVGQDMIVVKPDKVKD